MRIIWEESDLPALSRPGEYEFQVGDSWFRGAVACQEWADMVGSKRVGVGAKSPADQQYVIVIDGSAFIGPFENKDVLLSWLNATQRVRIRYPERSPRCAQ